MSTNKIQKRIFGTDGVRGVANIEPVTAETALKLGRAVGHVFKQINSEARDHVRHRVVIGKDTRLSGYMLENAICSGVLSMGVDVLLIGPLPTPGVAYVTRSLRADAGIVITASHNPYADNGIKFFRGDGYKLDDKIEGDIEELVFSGEIEHVRPTAEAIGKAVRIDDALGRYIEHAKASFPRGMTLEGMRIVADCANGASYKSTPCVLTELGAEVFVVGNRPDGKNINRECGSMHPDTFCQKVRELRADLGIAHDGDADRTLAVDHTGAVVDGDQIMAILALAAKDRGDLARNTLVATVMSNLGLRIAMKQAGIEMIETKVGDRYVLEQIREGGYTLGGEQSGHLIFSRFATTGDGILTGLQLGAQMASTGKSLKELASAMKVYPQVLINVSGVNKDGVDSNAELQKVVKEAESELGDNGRVLLRASGTEALVRVMVEASESGAAQSWAERIARVVERELKLP